MTNIIGEIIHIGGAFWQAIDCDAYGVVAKRVDHGDAFGCIGRFNRSCFDNPTYPIPEDHKYGNPNT